MLAMTVIKDEEEGISFGQGSGLFCSLLSCDGLKESLPSVQTREAEMSDLPVWLFPGEVQTMSISLEVL